MLFRSGSKWKNGAAYEVQVEPTGEDSISDAIMAEQVEEPVARETPALRRSERVRNAREILLLDNDMRQI